MESSSSSGSPPASSPPDYINQQHNDPLREEEEKEEGPPLIVQQQGPPIEIIVIDDSDSSSDDEDKDEDEPTIQAATTTKSSATTTTTTTTLTHDYYDDKPQANNDKNQILLQTFMEILQTPSYEQSLAQQQLEAFGFDLQAAISHVLLEREQQQQQQQESKREEKQQQQRAAAAASSCRATNMSSINDYLVLKKGSNHQTVAAAAAKPSHVHHRQQEAAEPSSSSATSAATTAAATNSLLLIPSSKRALLFSSSQEPAAVSTTFVVKETADYSDNNPAVQFVRMVDDIWQDCHAQCVSAGVDHLVDVEFPPMAQSLDGRKRQQQQQQDTEEQNQTNKRVILCNCGQPAAPRQVQSDGPNYGRFYLTCGSFDASSSSRGRRRRPPVLVVRKQEDNESEKTTITDKETSRNGDGVNNSQTRSPASTTATATTTAANSAKNNNPKIIIHNPYATAIKQPTSSSPSLSTTSSSSSSPQSPPQRWTKCNFFQWDPDGSIGASGGGSGNIISSPSSGYVTRYSLLSWQHFGIQQGCCLYNRKKNSTTIAILDPGQVRQGAVGNCWFLSALAVVAEKDYLIRQLLANDCLNDKGCYQVNLCLDGQWTPILVDSYLPVVIEDVMAKNKKKKNGGSTGPSVATQSFRGGVPFQDCLDLMAHPAFCATPDNTLWPALIEKAYAKAHGSYAQLSGGFIAEGLSDLTGACCETIILGNYHKNKNESLFSDGVLDGGGDDLWSRLLSFFEAGFLMGVATSQGGDGLVGGHAYSVLSVVEVPDSFVGEQSKMTDFFSFPSKKRRKNDEQGNGDSGDMNAEPDEDKKLPPGRQRTTVRLVRIRNPWGRREWKGAWSVNSEQWTKTLRKRLGTDASFAKGDGTFFMSFEDMCQRFHHMDVAKTREGWVHVSANGTFLAAAGLDPLVSSSNCIYRLVPSQKTAAFVSLMQPKKRSNTKSQYWYCDPCFMVLRRRKSYSAATTEATFDWKCEACSLTGVRRTSYCELILDPDWEYYCIPFSCVSRLKEERKDANFRICSYSAFPVLLEAELNVEVASSIRGQSVGILHTHLLCGQNKSVYSVAQDGVLACVHGQACLYLMAVNGSSDHYLSLRLTLNVQDGIVIVYGKSEDTHDIPPKSQRILLVASSNGQFSTTTQLQFRYLSATVAAGGKNKGHNYGTAGTGPKAAPLKKNSCELGSAIELSLAGELLTTRMARSSDQICNKGGDLIDTYQWIPQLGRVS